MPFTGFTAVACVYWQGYTYGSVRFNRRRQSIGDNWTWSTSRALFEACSVGILDCERKEVLVEGSFQVKSGVESDSQVGAICLAGYLCTRVYVVIAFWFERGQYCKPVPYSPV